MVKGEEVDKFKVRVGSWNLHFKFYYGVTG